MKPQVEIVFRYPRGEDGTVYALDSEGRLMCRSLLDRDYGGFVEGELDARANTIKDALIVLTNLEAWGM